MYFMIINKIVGYLVNTIIFLLIIIKISIQYHINKPFGNFR